jgi:hypothetical protein
MLMRLKRPGSAERRAAIEAFRQAFEDALVPAEGDFGKRVLRGQEARALVEQAEAVLDAYGDEDGTLNELQWVVWQQQLIGIFTDDTELSRLTDRHPWQDGAAFRLVNEFTARLSTGALYMDRAVLESNRTDNDTVEGEERSGLYLDASEAYQLVQAMQKHPNRVGEMLIELDDLCRRGKVTLLNEASPRGTPSARSLMLEQAEQIGLKVAFERGGPAPMWHDPPPAGTKPPTDSVELL